MDSSEIVLTQEQRSKFRIYPWVGSDNYTVDLQPPVARVCMDHIGCDYRVSWPALPNFISADQIEIEMINHMIRFHLL